eukprot:7591051-Pyramimonas_sp.AAC.1
MPPPSQANASPLKAARGQTSAVPPFWPTGSGASASGSGPMPSLEAATSDVMSSLSAFLPLSLSCA